LVRRSWRVNRRGCIKNMKTERGEIRGVKKRRKSKKGGLTLREGGD